MVQFLPHHFFPSKSGSLRQQGLRGQPSPPLWCSGSLRFLNGHQQIGMPYFSRLWGQKTQRMKEKSDFCLRQICLRAHIDRVSNFRTSKNKNRYRLCTAGTMCLVLFEDAHFCLCSGISICLGPRGSSLEEDKLRVGEKSSSLEMTAILKGEFFHPQTGVFMKFESRKIN